ncbi:MAG: hypothetical protein OEU76_04745 [Cyclobacteriaceae bacterium]|nr:hypothetical protein [Cyclobacteriaceae bacterium]
MATERDFELLDDYLSNRLSKEESAEVEGKIEADPELKQEFQFQQSVVESVRSKRAAELKMLLNNTPIPFSQTIQAELLSKVAASVVVAGLAVMAYYFYQSNDTAEQVQEYQNEQVMPSPEPSPDQNSTVQSEENIVKDSPSDSPTTKTIEKSSPSSTTNERSEATKNRERELVKVISSTFVTSNTEVITRGESEDYTYHYAFEDKKLVLFGSFEKNQYQILEFITKDEHVFFLNYKSNYYLLDDQINAPAALLPIQDTQLLKKLREFRTK